MNVSQMKKALENAKRRAASVKAKAEEAIGTAVRTGETVGGSFLASYARGRMGDDKGRWLIGSVDADLAGGLALHAVGFVVDEKYGDHAHALGDGALACYAAHKGFEFGRESKAKTAGRAPAQMNPRQYRPTVTESAFDTAPAVR